MSALHSSRIGTMRLLSRIIPEDAAPENGNSFRCPRSAIKIVLGVEGSHEPSNAWHQARGLRLRHDELCMGRVFQFWPVESDVPIQMLRKRTQRDLADASEPTNLAVNRSASFTHASRMRSRWSLRSSVSPSILRAAFSSRSKSPRTPALRLRNR